MRDVSWFFALLFIVFVGLKLAGVIDWPWLWVAAPAWLPLVVVSLVVTAIGFWMASRRHT